MLEEPKASAWTVVKSILIGGAKLAQGQDRPLEFLLGWQRKSFMIAWEC
jgi:hypothetical protein